jgi:hypothetical protein
MSVIRIKKARSKPYVILDTTALTDDRLSFRAKGIHTYLMSRPDDWQVHIEQLEKQSPREARDAIRAAMIELETMGYLRRQRVRGEKGRMMGWDTTVYETPLLAELDAEDERLAGDAIGIEREDSPITDYPTSDEPTSDTPKSVGPTSDGPTSAQPSSANPQLLINDSTYDGSLPSIESTHNPPTPLPQANHVPEPAPPKKKRGRQATAKHPFPEQFMLTAAMKEWAKENAAHVNIEQQTKKFAAHWRGDGKWMSDWNACWEKWMLNAEGWLLEKYPELQHDSNGRHAITHDEVEL